jgi:hypothetical protein
MPCHAMPLLLLTTVLCSALVCPASARQQVRCGIAVARPWRSPMYLCVSAGGEGRGLERCFSELARAAAGQHDCVAECEETWSEGEATQQSHTLSTSPTWYNVSPAWWWWCAAMCWWGALLDVLKDWPLGLPIAHLQWQHHECALNDAVTG